MRQHLGISSAKNITTAAAKTAPDIENSIYDTCIMFSVLRLTLIPASSLIFIS